MAIDYRHPGRGPGARQRDAPPPEVGRPALPPWLAAPASPAAAQPRRLAPELAPEEYLQRIFAASIPGRAAVVRQRQLVLELQRIQEDLAASRRESEPVLIPDRDALSRYGIDPGELPDMISRYRTAFGMSGGMRRLALRPRIEDALGRLHMTAQSRCTEAAGRLEDAERALAASITELRGIRPQVDAFLDDRPVIFAQNAGYIGDETARRFGGRMACVPHQTWSVVPIDGAQWSSCPVTSMSGTTWLTGSDAGYATGCAFARGQVLEQMAVAFPRRLIVTWIDPVGRGSSAGPLLEILEIDKDLLDTRVWSEPDEIEQALRRITDRMSYLEQRCLKSRFEDLEAYNLQAGSLAEPKQVVVVTGYPRNFTEDNAARLQQIQENGGRLGIVVHLVTDDSVDEPILETAHGYPAFRGVRFPTLRFAPSLCGVVLLGHAGAVYASTWAGVVDDLVFAPVRISTPSEQRAHAIVEGYATAAIEAATVVIDAESLAGDGRGAASTAEEIVLPIGALGRGDRLDLRLGRGLAQNLLVGGLPGSGKSTLFHTVITAAVRAYDPTELELYLLDFKEGVEFQPYATAGLPHARVVAIQSERAFGLSVLHGLREELAGRATRFKAAGVSSITEFRARTGEMLSRILVVIDEFQVLFAAEDAAAFECAGLLENLIRQGRSYGVHMILGTQTMRGTTQRLLGPALDLVALRITLKTSESDSELFLASDNRAASRLTRPGEAVYNPDGGRPESNLLFQVALTAEGSRAAVLAGAREWADAAGWTRRPLVFDGTASIDVRDDAGVAAVLASRGPGDARSIPLHWGLSVAIGGRGCVELWRRAGAHALMVSRDTEYLHGALTVGLVTASLGPAEPEITVIDCLGIDEDCGSQLGDVATTLTAIRCVRRRKLAEVVTEAAAEVRRRLDTDDYAARRRLLVINAIQRARELGDSDSFDRSELSTELMSILRDGADVGVHVVVTADGVETVARRLGRDGLTAIGLRLVGQCSTTASETLMGSPAAARLSPGYMLINNADDGSVEQVRPFPMPDARWLAQAASSRFTHNGRT